jgi:glutathione S-transferase
VVEILAARRDSDTEAESKAFGCFLESAGVIERALDGHEYLVGDRFGVADILCSGVLGPARRLGLLDPLPRIVSYLERLDARPARQRAYADAAAV